jgi:predicted O-methyltransferase YrrM
MTYREFLASVDDGHEMTTAREHIAELCHLAAAIRGGKIVELGSHAGISTAALAMASPTSEIVSVDLCDTIREQERVSYWESLGLKNITPVACSAREYLDGMTEQVDMIFHDADHGERALPEYLAAGAKCKTLAIHDWEQLSLASRSAVRSLFATWLWPKPDARGRHLHIGSNA